MNFFHILKSALEGLGGLYVAVLAVVLLWRIGGHLQ